MLAFIVTNILTIKVMTGVTPWFSKNKYILYEISDWV